MLHGVIPTFRVRYLIRCRAVARGLGVTITVLTAAVTNLAIYRWLT
jgi:hypothetical protein